MPIKLPASFTHQEANQFYLKNCTSIFSSKRHFTHSIRLSSQVTSKNCLSYKPRIGLEIHAQILSKNKLFSNSLRNFEPQPNRHVTLFDGAHPGILPTLNPDCVRKAIKAVLGLGGDVQLFSQFERKHYFYPDLPLGYQITQHQFPIGRGGKLLLGESDQLSYQRLVRIGQIQLEQDTANLVASQLGTGINLNRAGVGLLEVVTLPDITTSEEAAKFLLKLQRLFRYLGISNGNLEEGSMRCDVNVSVSKVEQNWGTRVELKNLHTPRIISSAIDAEIRRQIDVLETGGKVNMETRGFDVATKETFHLRSKETAPDYRYMVDPDIPTLNLDPLQVQKISDNLPELPDQIFDRWVHKLGLSPKDAYNLLSYPRYFESVLSFGQPPQMCANWINSTLQGIIAKQSQTLDQCPVSPAQLNSIIACVSQNKISGKIGKDLLIKMAKGDIRNAEELIASERLAMIEDPSILLPILEELIKSNGKRAEKVRAGDSRASSWFLGQVMRHTKGQANPILTQKLLNSLL